MAGTQKDPMKKILYGLAAAAMLVVGVAVYLATGSSAAPQSSPW
jgi:hypothetical protein